MLQILFLDDDRSRLAYLLGTLRAAGIEAKVTHRATAEAVTDEDLDAATVVFLDHDLCPAHYPYPMACTRPVDGECRCQTGMVVARRIVTRPAVPGQRYVVQSMSRRAPAMAHALARRRGPAVHVPFDDWRGKAAHELAAMFGLTPAPGLHTWTTSEDDGRLVCADCARGPADATRVCPGPSTPRGGALPPDGEPRPGCCRS